MTEPSEEPAVVVDCLGRPCPLPVIQLAKAVQAAQVGDVIEVRADDPAAEGDIQAWCRMRGQAYEGADGPSYRVRKLS